MSADAPSLDTALGQFKEMMASDGYSLSWTVTPQDTVVVQVDAGPDACEDCLVPLPIMEAIMSDALDATPYKLDHIVLPAESSH